MIKTIIFDLNDVLITRFDINIKEKFEEEIGIDISSFWKIASKDFGNLNLGKFTLNEFYKKTLLELGLNPSSTKKVREIHESEYSMIKGMEELLKKLKKNYKLILFAGDNKEGLKYKLDKFKLKQYFDKIYCTCFEGIFKDNPKFLKKIIKESKLKPEKTLFIDDMSRHTKTAEKLGIKTILFKNTEQLREELKKLDII